MKYIYMYIYMYTYMYLLLFFDMVKLFLIINIQFVYNYYEHTESITS